MDRQVHPRAPALGNRGDLRQRRDQRHHRPARAPGSRARAAGAGAGGAGPARRCAARREERRAAALPLSLAAASLGVPVLLALRLPGQGLRPRPQPAAGAGAAAGRGRDRGDAARGAPPRRRDRRRPARLLARLLRLGQLLARPAAARLGRGRRQLGEPAAPRAIVTWALGEASLRYYLSTGAFQVAPPKATTGSSTKSTSSPTAGCPRRRRACSAPASAKPAHEGAGRLFVRRYELPGPGLAPLRLRRLRGAELNFRTTGVLLDGVGPG